MKMHSNSLKSSCPLSLAAQEIPTQLVLDGSSSFTYLELDSYAQQLQEFLRPFPKNSTFALIPHEPSFFIALLFACLREGHRIFPLSFRIPNPEDEFSKAKGTHFFKEPISFNSSQKEPSETFIDPDIPLTYLLTSGSTSAPKICVHSFTNHYYSALGSNELLDYKRGKRWLLSLPLFHISGLSLVFRTILAQATLVTSPTLEEAILSQNLTHLSLVPTQLQRLIKNPNLPTLSCILLGGAPISSSLLKAGAHLPLFPTYGLTEMSSQVATYDPHSQKISLLPYRELCIEKGEILVKGKTLFLGYLEQGKLRKPFDQNGYFHTRDHGSYLHEHLTYQGRADNLFISGGENIQPEEVERVLLSHPEVTEAIVTPIKDAEFGARPYAWIKTKQKLDRRILTDYLSSHLPKFKLPIGYSRLEYTGLKPSRKELIAKSPTETSL